MWSLFYVGGLFNATVHRHDESTALYGAESDSVPIKPMSAPNSLLGTVRLWKRVSQD